MSLLEKLPLAYLMLNKKQLLVFKNFAVPDLLVFFFHTHACHRQRSCSQQFLKSAVILGLSTASPASSEPLKSIQKKKIYDVYPRRLLKMNLFIEI